MLSLQTHPGVDTTAQLLFSLKPPSESFKTDAGTARFEDYLASYSINDRDKTASLNEDELAMARQVDKAADPKSAGNNDLDAEEGKVVEDTGVSGEGKDIFLSTPNVLPPVHPNGGEPAKIVEEGSAETVSLEDDSAGGALLGGMVPEIDGTHAADLGAVTGTDAANEALGEEAAARVEDLGESSITMDARQTLPAKTAHGESLPEPALTAETDEAELEAALKMVTLKKTAENGKEGLQAEDAEKKAAPDAVAVKNAEEGERKETGQLPIREGRAAGSKNAAQPKTAQRPAAEHNAAAVPETAGNPAAASGGEAAGVPSVELTVSADALSAAQSSARSSAPADAASTAVAGEAPGAGRGLFSPEAQNALNGDIVRHANIMLRSGGEGLIRLSLKPESLGNVKIRLHLAENKISGQIVVETAEALKAFEQQVHELEKSLAAQGYDSAKLEMSLAQHGNDGQRPENAETFTFSSGRAAALYDRASDCIEIKAGASLYFPERELDILA